MVPQPAQQFPRQLAGRSVEADTIVADLRLVATRLEQSGPAGPFADSPGSAPREQHA